MNTDLLRFLRYIEFKGECVAYQEANPLRLDMERIDRNIAELEKLELEKIEHLKKVMPPAPKKRTRARPKNLTKRDGTLSVAGAGWFQFLREQKLPATTLGPVSYVHEYVEPNPGSTDQVKSWLFSLGWDPCTFDYKKDSEGNEKAIPQVRQNGELTPSVEALIERQPELEHLGGLTVIQHRLGIFRGFKDEAVEIDGQFFAAASVGGLTNTLRFKHKKPMVNLPGVDKPWGDEIRASIIAPDGHEVVGSDMVSLEATTKAHYIFPYDPDYARALTREDFDEHLDLALQENEVTQDDIDYYKTAEEETQRYKNIHKIRKMFKPVNYSAVYGVGVKKLSRTTGYSMKVCSQLLKAYWKKNWAVKELVKPLRTKEVNGYTWLQNPVSGFWYELRYDKDRFSTLNQGTGVYIFDSWLKRASTRGYWGSGQFHDETLGFSKLGEREVTTARMEGAIEQLNKEVELNVKMGIDIKYGDSYAAVH